MRAYRSASEEFLGHEIRLRNIGKRGYERRAGFFVHGKSSWLAATGLARRQTGGGSHQDVNAIFDRLFAIEI
jgi:hypothetical protein